MLYLGTGIDGASSETALVTAPLSPALGTMIPCAEDDGARRSSVNPPNNKPTLHLRFIPLLRRAQFASRIFNGCIDCADFDLEDMAGWWKRSIKKLKLFYREGETFLANLRGRVDASEVLQDG